LQKRSYFSDITTISDEEVEEILLQN